MKKLLEGINKALVVLIRDIAVLIAFLLMISLGIAALKYLWVYILT